MFRRLFLLLGVVAAIFLLPLLSRAQTPFHKVVPAILAVQVDSAQSTIAAPSSTIVADTLATVHKNHFNWFWPLCIVLVVCLIIGAIWYFSKSRRGDDNVTNYKVKDREDAQSGRDRRT
jgi:uncharacterized ion transporter superfamily protein YfcC